MKQTLLLLIFCFQGFLLFAQNSFQFNEQEVLAGTKKHFTIKIADSENETVIPITVFHGAKKGPVVGITAGVHGYEYAPILAGQQLIKRIDTKELTGTIILVQIANVGSFLGRSPFINPLDEKNLNRVFPGKSDGTITERIAYFISEKVINRCDYFIDMHSGDSPEDLMPYSAYYQHDDKKEISEKGRSGVASMGFDHIVVFETTEKEYMQKDSPSLYCSAEAFKRGIPSIDIECGKLGMVEQHLVDKISDGIMSFFKHLGMLEGEPLETKGIAYISERDYTSSKHTGFFYPLKASGSYVKEGMKVGYITDFFNEIVEEIYASENGIILYMLGTPPVNEGETLLVVGNITE